MDPQVLTQQFNAAINARDLEALGRLMTDDHRFVDPAGHVDSGKTACLESWRGFFAQFPDYRNVFTDLHSREDTVLVVGYSTCSFEPLSGPALWQAIARGGQLAEWRVYEDTAATRQALQLA